MHHLTTKVKEKCHHFHEKGVQFSSSVDFRLPWPTTYQDDVVFSTRRVFSRKWPRQDFFMHYLTTNVKEKFHHFHEKGDYFFDNCCWFPFLLTDDVAHPSKWMVPRDDRLCVFLCHQTTTWNKMKSSVLREPRFLNNTLSARTTL